jgi:hypothetical protein
MRNPTHFEIISSRRFFDHDRADAISSDNAELIELTGRTPAEAFAAGQLRPADLKQVQIAGRALVYGFARMNIDGHFPRWGVAGPEAEHGAPIYPATFVQGQIHCAFMTIPLRFYDTTRVPAGSCVSWSSPVKALHCAG